MEKQLLEFARKLRSAGLVVSSSEVADAALAVRALGAEEGDTEGRLAWVLRACLVKSSIDRPLFEKVFALFFADRAWNGPKVTTGAEKAGRLPRLGLGEPFGRERKVLTATGAGLGRGAGAGATSGDIQPAETPGLAEPGGEEPLGLDGLKPPARALLEALLAGDATASSILARSALDVVVPKEERRPPLAQSPRDILEQVLIYLDWYWVSHRAARSGVEPPVITRCELAIRREVELFLITTFGESALRQVVAGFDLRRKNLGTLTASEEELVAEYCRRIGRALAVRRGYRYRHSRSSGRVDPRRTARAAAARGGVPVALCRRRPRPSFPQLVVLADVSGSVRRFSRFFLELCWGLRERFGRTEVFFFVDRLARATDVLAADSVAGALEWAFTAAPVSLTNNSDYGSVFAQFIQEGWVDLLDSARGTTVIVLGDGRNNWRPSGIEFLADIARLSRAILWLNPLPRSEWGSRDALIGQYLPFCRRAWSCGSVLDLERVAAELVREQTRRV